MSYLEKVTEEITGNAGSQEQPAETKVETPVETKEETKVETPTETKEEPPKETKVETKVETPKVETKVETPVETPTETKDEPPKEKKEKPDLSTLTKEQKAEHAFKRQLEKQKAKYETQIQQMHDSFQKQFDDFKNEFKKNKPKEEPKTRADFETDDDYIKYLVKSQNDAEHAEAEEKRLQQEKEQREFDEQRREVSERFQQNCRAAFNDEESYAAFATKVNKGLNNGLGEILDQAPAVRDYLFGNPNGPTVLNEMLSNKDSFIRVMSNAGNPMSAVIEMHELAREIANRSKQPDPTPAPQPEQPKQMPHLGKPGTVSGGARTSVFDSDRDLIKFIRSR